LTQKFQVEGVAPTNHSSSQKTRLNDLAYGIKISTDLSSDLSQSTHLTDRQTDRQTDGQTDGFIVASLRWHSMQREVTIRITQEPKTLLAEYTQCKYMYISFL